MRTLIAHALLYTLVIVGGVSASLAQGKPADWRLFGFNKIDGQDIEVFYSASELRHNARGNVEVWTKGLPMLAVNNDALSEAEIHEAAQKLLYGYKPLVASIEPVTKDQVAGAIAAEMTANADRVSTVSRILFELNCGERLVRSLSVWMKSKGKTNSSETEGQWMHAAPETNGATLLNKFCSAP